MEYKKIQWLILIIPTITIAAWEYTRHTLLLPYLSMGLGNFLAPIIVLLVTLTLVRKLMRMLEQSHESLQRERAGKAALVEREQLARELHDGISQSLFLLAVKIDRLEQEVDVTARQTIVGQLRSTVRRIYDDVRQSITNLRQEPSPEQLPWLQPLMEVVQQLKANGVTVDLQWKLRDEMLDHRQKVELMAIVREALLNCGKHAQASQVIITALPQVVGGFYCLIQDNGAGATADMLSRHGCYGVKMMQERAMEQGWTLQFSSTNGLLVEIIGKVD